MAVHKIDVIIPIYQAHDTLVRTLCSIGTQTIIDQINVVLVNDADGKNYDYAVNMFKDFYSIKEIKLDKNVGCGQARQKGVDNTSAPYIMFIDADDTLASPFTMSSMLNILETRNDFHTVVGSAIEEQKNNIFLNYSENFIWVWGKLYRRSFIEKYGIHFSPFRISEDVGYNTMLKLFSNKEEKICFIDEHVYNWHFNKKSITRLDTYDFLFRQNISGLVDNYIYAIKYAISKIGTPKHVDFIIMEIMCNLYILYNEAYKKAPQFDELNLKKCVLFYKEIYNDVEKRVDFKEIAEFVAQSQMYKTLKQLGVEPRLSFYDFVRELRKG